MNQRRLITKILCLDQSTKRTGWSYWTDGKLKDYGRLDSNIEENNPVERMAEMYRLVSDIIKRKRPDFVVMEGVQFQKNYRTYSQLSQLQGVLFSILFERQIAFCLIEPNSWRKHCGITGRKRVEQKASAIQTVSDKFKIEAEEDIAEAILIGVWATDTHESKELTKIEQEK